MIYWHHAESGSIGFLVGHVCGPIFWFLVGHVCCPSFLFLHIELALCALHSFSCFDTDTVKLHRKGGLTLLLSEAGINNTQSLQPWANDQYLKFSSDLTNLGLTASTVFSSKQNPFYSHWIVSSSESWMYIFSKQFPCYLKNLCTLLNNFFFLLGKYLLFYGEKVVHGPLF